MAELQDFFYSAFAAASSSSLIFGVQRRPPQEPEPAPVAFRTFSTVSAPPAGVPDPAGGSEQAQACGPVLASFMVAWM